jgi:hypothetical protein
MAKNKGGKKGKQERKAKADSRQMLREHGCQEVGCKAIATVFLQTRTRTIKLCPEHARKRGHCQTCFKKRDSLEEGICAGCWAKMRLGLSREAATA